MDSKGHAEFKAEGELNRSAVSVQDPRLWAALVGSVPTYGGGRWAYNDLAEFDGEVDPHDGHIRRISALVMFRDDMRFDVEI